MKLTIEIDNVYEDGQKFVEQKAIDVDPPGDDVEDWAEEWLYPETGTGRIAGFEGLTKTPDAGYFVKILECSEMPELVGREFEWGT